MRVMRFNERLQLNEGRLGNNIGCYYIPYKKKDMVLIKRGLEKFGVINLDRILEQMDEYDNWKGFYLFIDIISGEKNGSWWLVRDKYDIVQLEKHIEKEKITYSGEYKLDEHEVSAIKYNL